MKITSILKSLGLAIGILFFGFNGVSQDTLSYANKSKIFKQILEDGNIYLDPTEKYFCVNQFSKNKSLFKEGYFLEYLESNNLELVRDELEQEKTMSFDLDFFDNSFSYSHWTRTSKDAGSSIGYGDLTEVYFFYDNNLKLKGPLVSSEQDLVNGFILKQLLEQIEFEVDSTIHHFELGTSTSLPFYSDWSFFKTFIQTNDFEVVKMFDHEFKNTYQSSYYLLIDFNNQILYWIKSNYEEDESTGEHVFTDTATPYYYRLDSDNNVIGTPSMEYRTKEEKRAIFKYILNSLDGNLDTTYFNIQSELDYDFLEFKNGLFAQEFYSNNDFQNSDQTIYLELNFFSEKELIHIHPVSYFDDSDTGERTFYGYHYDDFYFKLSGYANIRELTKEEYQKLLKE